MGSVGSVDLILIESCLSWRRQWLSSDVGTGGSNAAWQSLFSLSVIFLVAPRFRQHHQALIQAMVNMLDVWLMYGTSQADPFRELLESFCVLNMVLISNTTSTTSTSSVNLGFCLKIVYRQATGQNQATLTTGTRCRLFVASFASFAHVREFSSAGFLVDPFTSASLMN